MEVTSHECIQAIQEALKTYGEYTYYDKGPREVIDDIYNFVSRFKKMPAAKVRKVLDEVANYKDGGIEFVSVILLGMQDVPDAYWEELMESELLQEIF